MTIAEKRGELGAFAKTPEGRARIKEVAEEHGIEGGRSWARFSSLEIELLHLHALGEKKKPEEIEKEPFSNLDDDSDEGRAFNDRIPF